MELAEAADAQPPGAAQAEHAAVVQSRVDAVERWSGSFSEGYEPDLLERIREDWPT